MTERPPKTDPAPDGDEPPIPAATVVMLRDDPTFEVLMVERHANIAFAGGAMVFPGGRVDPSDRLDDWRDHATGLSDDPSLAAGQIAAIREAFEEAGLLLARPDGADGPGGAFLHGDDVADLDHWRKEIEADDSVFLSLVREQKLTLAADAMALFAHWVAPPRIHKRFDTLFFAAIAPPTHTARQDGDEATEAIWISPDNLLAAADSGARKLIFPTRRNVELLATHKSADDAIKGASARPIRPICPTIETRDGRPYLTIPDDLGYPVTAEALEDTFRG